MTAAVELPDVTDVGRCGSLVRSLERWAVVDNASDMNVGLVVDGLAAASTVPEMARSDPCGDESAGGDRGR